EGLAARVEKLPLEAISTVVRKTLQAASSLLHRLDTQVTREVIAALSEAREAVDTANTMMAADKPLQRDTLETIRDLGRTAKSLRALTDFIVCYTAALLCGTI